MAAADLHSAVLEMFAGLEADERLAGQGLAEAFAEAFPAVPAASAHLARALMMVALLPRGLIGGLGEDPDAVSYPESKHAST